MQMIIKYSLFLEKAFHEEVLHIAFLLMGYGLGKTSQCVCLNCPIYV